jgi:hypothetical protein
MLHRLRPLPLIAALPAIVAQATAQVTLTPVAVTGAPAPGLPGATLADVFDPVITNTGAVAFRAAIAAPPAPAFTAVLADQGAGFAPLVRTGVPAPGEPDILAAIPSFAFSSTGVLAFPGAFPPLGTPPATRFAVFSASPGPAIGVLARQPQGEQTFPARVGATSFGDTLWSTGAAALVNATPLASRGDPAPGYEPGSLLRFFNEPAANIAGHAVFRASAGVNPDSSDARHAIWTNRAGTLEFVARVGDPAPNQPAGTTFIDLGPGPVIFASGDIVFTARTALGVAPVRQGLWVATTSGTTRASPIAQSGDELVLLPPSRFASLSGRPAPAGARHIVFSATLSEVPADRNSGVFRSVVSCCNATPIALEGTPAPGVANASFASFVDPVASPRGRAAFLATLRGTGVTPAGNLALYAERPSGQLSLIVRTGQAIEVAPGQTRTVRSIIFDSGPAESGAMQFNSRGELVFTAEFTNNSRAVLRTRVGCPADFNGDDGVDFNDLLVFVDLLNNGSPDADLTGEGVVDFNDWLEFLNLYNLPC